MKLKLEVEGNVTILSVSETIENNHLPVLKAGLKKLFAAQKKLVILDLLNVSESSFASELLAQELSSISKWAQEQQAQVEVLSKHAAISTVKSREEALRVIKSPLSKLLQTEANLEAELKTLERQKAELSQKVDPAGAAEFKTLRRQNSDLKKLTKHFEELIQKYLAKRSQPFESGALRSKQDTVRNLLITVLEQEGAIAVKTK